MNAPITLASTIDHLTKRVAELEKDLGFCVMEGSPFLLIVTVASAYGDLDLVYGQWKDVEAGKPCFRSLEILPDHLCGTSQFSEAGVEKAIAQVRKDGLVGGAHTIVRVSKLHNREEKRRRLALAKDLLAKLQAKAA